MDFQPCSLSISYRISNVILGGGGGGGGGGIFSGIAQCILSVNQLCGLYFQETATVFKWKGSNLTALIN